VVLRAEGSAVADATGSPRPLPFGRPCPVDRLRW